jgi:hypothetical protein
MAKDSKSDIDPRFDPAFQRGFDPSIPIEESVPQRQPRPVAVPPVLRAPATAPASVEPAASVAPTAVATPAPPTTPAAGPSPAVAQNPGADIVDPDAEGTDAPEDADALAETDSEPSAARNPFLLFLGIIAVALIAVGVWLFVRSGEAFNSREVRSQGDYMTLTATINMAPFIALLGVATVIGVLFVFAARWKRRAK